MSEFIPCHKTVFNLHFTLTRVKIKSLHARQILDSRGNPTVEADIFLADGSFGRAAVPSGASTGSHEALELRDNDPKVYLGKGVLKAVHNINTTINDVLMSAEIATQKELDQKLIHLDGTDTKSNLGANAILAVSLAFAKATAASQKVPLYEYLHTLSGIKKPISLPIPMMNIINGGAHAAFACDIQEFMIIPVGAKTFAHAIQIGTEVFHSLKTVLKERGYATTVGDEGGFAPNVKSGNKESLEMISRAVEIAGYELGRDVVFGLDIAASEFFKDGKYTLKAEGKVFNSDEMVGYLEDLVNNYPIVSIEDGLSESDWDGWIKLTSKLGKKIQLVGDDLLVTNTKFLQKAIELQACNAILVKLNQIGTLTETIDAIKLANSAGFNAITSHRSGETEDATIAHVAVGLATGQIKTGSLSRTDRVAKYNEILRIEEQTNGKAVFETEGIFFK